jgi:hypothetical protein
MRKSRRSFRRALAGLVALTVAVSMYLFIAAQLSFDAEHRKYGITINAENAAIDIATPWGPITGSPASLWQVAWYTPLLKKELNKYPVSLVDRTGLSRIVLVRDLSFAGQRRSAVPDWTSNVLYLDVARANFNTPYLRKTFHHEFFHIIDYRDDGSVYADPTWAALNREGVRYGSGGSQLQDDPEVSVPTNAYAGFLNRYSMQGVEEDKAEIFACLMADPLLLQERLGRDRILASKVERMKALLKAFCPEADKSFWPQD